MKAFKAEKVEILSSSLKELSTALSARATNKILVLAGNCNADFDGRIKSYLDWGDRLLIVKPDDSILLHGPAGVKPINWQKEKEGKINFAERNELLVMSTYRPRTQERFTVAFREIFMAYTFAAHDPAQLEITGDESHFAQYLSNHTDLIEAGLEVIALEYQTPHGYIDLLCRDFNGTKLIIELKKQAASLADAQQLARYRNSFVNDGQSIRAMLVAPGFSARVNRYLQKNGLEATKIAWQDIFPTLPPDPQQPSLDKYL
ncbi:MAG: endonuclease NucS domain-containing protein [Candidatus Heimdallarchaeota archaeon]